MSSILDMTINEFKQELEPSRGLSKGLSVLTKEHLKKNKNPKIGDVLALGKEIYTNTRYCKEDHWNELTKLTEYNTQEESPTPIDISEEKMVSQSTLTEAYQSIKRFECENKELRLESKRLMEKNNDLKQENTYLKSQVAGLENTNGNGKWKNLAKLNKQLASVVSTQSDMLMENQD